MTPPPFLRRHLAALAALAIFTPAAFANFSFTDAGPYDYNDTANWDGGTINNQWISSLTDNQTITFAADTTLSSGIVINNNSAFNHVFIGSGANRTLTLGGNISLGSASNSNTVTFGSNTDGQQLNIDLGDASRTISTSTNRTLNILNVISGTKSITKTGAGTLYLANTANTYTGSTSLGSSGVIAGVLEVTKLANGGQASSIGSSSNAATNLVFGGITSAGTLRYVGTGDSTDRRFLIGGVGASFDASGTGALHYTNTAAPTYASSGQPRTVTLKGTNTDGNSMAASFGDSGAGQTSILKQGTGRWILTGANTYTGTTTIDAGTLQLGDSDRLAATSSLVMNGGTFATAGFSQTLGVLSLTATSVIDLGAGASALVFADSSGESWGSSIGLSFVNFTQGVDSIRIGTTRDSLTETQLAQITINGFAAAIDDAGFLSAIPEPSTYAFFGGAGVLAVAFLRRRRAA